ARGFVRMSVEVEMGFADPGGRRARGFVRMSVEVEMGFADLGDVREDELLISTSNRKRPGRPKNEVWQHFDTIPVDSTNGKKDLHSGAACKFCKQKWSRGKTSEMIAHLALQCPKPPPPEQSKITNHVEKLTVTDDKQRRCSRALTKFFVTCGVPLWIVENPFFIDYSKELCPGFQVPKRTILSTTMINVETATVIAEMKKKLSNETNLTLGGREKSANELIAQISNYSLKSKPYDFEFVTGIHTVKNWWLMCKQQNNHIQKLALLMASIVPSNASCERYFSVLGWYMNKRRTSLNCSLLQNMLQMHAYYVSNISNEIKHAYKELSDEGFEDAVTKTTFPFDDEIFDENDDELENNQFENDDELENNQFENDDELENNQFENNEGENQISNSQNFDSFFNVTDIELRRVLEIEVTVEIPLSTEYTDSGEQDFNIESIINKSLERRES
ncbi:8932_t:CDS:2, partial [Dentiscutata erythropus]